MASKRELLLAANSKKSKIPTVLVEEEPVPNNQIVKEEIHKSESVKESLSQNDTVVPEEVKPVEAPTVEPEVINVPQEEPVVPKPVKATKKAKVDAPQKTITFRLATEQDLTFLNIYPIQMGMSKKDYFSKLIEDDIKASSKGIDFKDSMVRSFAPGSITLKSRSTSITISEDLIEEIKKSAIKHRMRLQHYLAYVVCKARLNAKDYEDFE